MKSRSKKALAVLLIATLVIMTAGSIGVFADFGNGVAVLAEGTEIVKTALVGKKLVFSDLDFKQGLCITDFEKIKITEVPPSSEGTLILAGRRVSAGTEIKRKNIGALVFIPAGRDVEECKFKFTTDDFADGKEVTFIIKYTDKVNYAPKIESTDEKTVSLLTQREISVYGKMKANDKEGDLLEYVVIKYPEIGNLTLINKNSGEYLYTPPENYVGEDSFTYVARDEWGNYSKPEKVSITVDERMSEVVYTDMIKHPEYNAAVAMTAMGIMDGRLIGDGVYFMPDSEITLAEFVSMAMKSAGIKPEPELTVTFFDDDSSIPSALKGYVATAQKMGIITGTFDGEKLLFNPSSSVSRYEAAVIMANIMDAEITGELPVFNDNNTIPVWAKTSVGVMYSLGVFDNESELIDGNEKITKAECASYLYKLALNFQG